MAGPAAAQTPRLAAQFPGGAWRWHAWAGCTCRDASRGFLASLAYHHRAFLNVKAKEGALWVRGVMIELALSRHCPRRLVSFAPLPPACCLRLSFPPLHEPCRFSPSSPLQCLLALRPLSVPHTVHAHPHHSVCLVARLSFVADSPGRLRTSSPDNPRLLIVSAAGWHEPYGMLGVFLQLTYLSSLNKPTLLLPLTAHFRPITAVLVQSKRHRRGTST